jgi:hypothetical protein
MLIAKVIARFCMCSKDLKYRIPSTLSIEEIFCCNIEMKIIYYLIDSSDRSDIFWEFFTNMLSRVRRQSRRSSRQRALKQPNCKGGKIIALYVVGLIFRGFCGRREEKTFESRSWEWCTEFKL